MIYKLQNYLKHPFGIIVNVIYKLKRFVPDKLYVKVLYKENMGNWPDLKNPKTFNEKLSWIKLYDRNPLYTKLADKYSVKEYVAQRIGSEYVVDNYCVANRWEDINFETLPCQFVIKCTHDSGGAFICRDKKSFDYDSVKKMIQHNLQCNYFYPGREWPYKNIKPRIIVDKYLDDHTGNELRDYKFWCFGGRPTYMYCTIKGDNVFENFYDMNFVPVAIDHGYPRHTPEFERPKNFELMEELASKLSKGIPFVRVDFFEVDGKVYFGEFTFFDWGGLRPFGGDWDVVLGELIALPPR